MGTVCRKHEEWCPDGVCRWCEPPIAPAIIELADPPPVPTSAQWGGNLNNQAAAQQNATAANMMGGLGAWLPPNPYPGAVAHDYDLNFACRRCGHHFLGYGQPFCPGAP